MSITNYFLLATFVACLLCVVDLCLFIAFWYFLSSVRRDAKRLRKNILNAKVISEELKRRNVSQGSQPNPCL